MITHPNILKLPNKIHKVEGGYAEIFLPHGKLYKLLNVFGRYNAVKHEYIEYCVPVEDGQVLSLVGKIYINEIFYVIDSDTDLIKILTKDGLFYLETENFCGVEFEEIS